MHASKKVILVDDESDLVDLWQTILVKLGYDVVGFNTPSGALDYFNTERDSMDILITDFTMPEISGLQLARHIHDIQKNLPVIICTGYSEKLDGIDLEKNGIRKVLVKPVKMKTLVDAIEEFLLVY